ncbi:MAG: methylated-DNA--[protein]-cysteine S-methyltransferase [Acidimicrobiales bacterium]
MNETIESALAGLYEPAPATLLDRVTAELGLVDVYLTVDSPAGPLWVAFNKSGVSFLDAVAHQGEDAFRRAFAARYPGRALRPADTTTTPPTGLTNALSGNRATLRYDLRTCSPFQQAVLAKTSEIPRGEVRSYGWIAREIGHDGATRAVGTALGRNPVPVLIPCHRVVRTDGKIGNYALGSAMKTRLLQLEGVDLDELSDLAQAGRRYVGSATTNIFCVPTCHHARRIQPHNRVLFRTEREAADKGFRPCQTCRPAPALSTT